MKFNCDSCGVAYMISDEKVGPNGVRVRCKKCGNQITVRRPEGAPPAPILERAAPAASPGLDDELGSAFDQAFSDGPGVPAPAPAEPAPPPPPPPPAPAARPSPPIQEWYVAIGEAQVGPLPLSEVRRRWEAGDIGPDSLVWRPGMAEWSALSANTELAAFLAPVPQPRGPSVVAPSAVLAAPAPPARAPASPTPGPPAPEVEWKPSGASALAALASDELASREPTPLEKPAPRRSVMDQLPDSGGVDPTGAVPLPIRAMEQTDERPVRRSSVARGAQELRRRRTIRTTLLVSLLVVVAGGGGAIAWIQLTGSRPPAATPQVAVAPAAAPVAAPVPVAPPAVPAPATAGSNEAVAAPAVASAPAEVAAPVPAPPPAPVAAAAPRKAKPPAPVAQRPARPPVARVAPAAPAVPTARPTEKPAARKKDGLLDFDQGGEDDLAAALGTGAGGRKVYVPPAAGGAAAAPDRLSDAQILESVKLHADELRRCVSEQQAREPGARGTIKVAWVIQADGSPRDVRCITPEYAQGEFARCMTGVVRAIRFSRVADPRGQSVTFPFTF